MVAAGSTIRNDVGTNQVVSAGPWEARQVTYDPTTYRDVRQKLVTTARLTGNLQALLLWYSAVRLEYAGEDEKPLEGAMQRIDVHLRHRVKELDKVSAKIETAGQHPEVEGLRTKINGFLVSPLAIAEINPPHDFLTAYEAGRNSQSHIDAIRGLSDQAAAAAGDWLAAAAGEKPQQMLALLGVLK